MEVLLAATVVVVALAALGSRAARGGPRRLLHALLGRALPGARTGRPDPATARPGAAVEPVQLRWTEVVNLTAADLAGPPRRARAPREREQAQARTR